MQIEFHQVRFTYPDGPQALSGVSLQFEPGEQVAIVGENGAGKTSLVKHINGLLKPSAGSVWVGGWDTRQRSIAQMASRVAYVFQNPDEQLFDRRVHQEVAFGPRNLGFSPERTEELVRQAIALTGLQGQAEANPYDLSPTMRKMVALASSLAMDCPILIIDEPTTGQDAAGIERIGQVVSHLRRLGRTVIVISHDIDFCAENFERFVVMSQGTILMDGPASSVLGQAELLAEAQVEAPQLTRLGFELGFQRAILSAEEFLRVYRSRDQSK